MFLATISDKKTGRTILKIVESRRENGRSKKHMIQNLGYLDELEKIYPDPIAHFKEVAKQMTLEKKEKEEARHVQLDPNASLPKQENLSPTAVARKNLGYAALSKLYHEIKIDVFLNNHQRYKKFAANLNSIQLRFKSPLRVPAAQGSMRSSMCLTIMIRFLRRLEQTLGLIFLASHSLRRRFAIFLPRQNKEPRRHTTIYIMKTFSLFFIA